MLLEETAVLILPLNALQTPENTHLQSPFCLVCSIPFIANNHFLDIYYCLHKTCSFSLSLTYYTLRHSSKSLVETWIDFMVCYYCHVFDSPWLAFKSTASRGKKKASIGPNFSS